MSIDAIGAIGSNIIASVGATAASSAQLAPDNTGQDVGQSQVDDQATAQQDATVTTISDQALALQQAGADQTALAATATASTDTVTAAVSSDWGAGAPTADNPAVQAALDALDEASRANQQAEADAIVAQQDRAAQDQKAADAAATAAVQQHDTIVLAAINAGIQLAFGALASPITGDPALRQPGLDVVA